MDRLSPELLSLIIGHLYGPVSAAYQPPRARRRRDPLPPPRVFIPYATVSRAWQAAVEAHVFASIKLASPDLEAFTDIFGPTDDGRRRRRALRRLEYDVVLPTYTAEQCDEVETDAQADANSATFDKAVRALFAVLAPWTSSDGTSERNLTLLIKAHSPMDPGYRPSGIVPSNETDRMERRFLALSGESELPAVGGVRRFEVPNGPRQIHGGTLMRITGALRDVQDVSLEISSPKLKWPELRREQRNGTPLLYRHVPTASTQKAWLTHVPV